MYRVHHALLLISRSTSVVAAEQVPASMICSKLTAMPSLGELLAYDNYFRTLALTEEQGF